VIGGICALDNRRFLLSKGVALLLALATKLGDTRPDRGFLVATVDGILD
jgi:hypothetical protein